MNNLYHHGIKGQEWGVRNGPPYPLDRATKKQIKKMSPYNRYQTKAIISSTNDARTGKYKGRTDYMMRREKDGTSTSRALSGDNLNDAQLMSLLDKRASLSKSLKRNATIGGVLGGPIGAIGVGVVSNFINKKRSKQLDDLITDYIKYNNPGMIIDEKHTKHNK